MEQWVVYRGFSCNRVSNTEVFKVTAVLMTKSIWIIHAFWRKHEVFSVLWYALLQYTR
jgi:hypothetical protein